MIYTPGNLGDLEFKEKKQILDYLKDELGKTYNDESVPTQIMFFQRVLSYARATRGTRTKAMRPLSDDI